MHFSYPLLEDEELTTMLLAFNVADGIFYLRLSFDFHEAAVARSRRGGFAAALLCMVLFVVFIRPVASLFVVGQKNRLRIRVVVTKIPLRLPHTQFGGPNHLPVSKRF